MAEWSIAAVLKTVELRGSGGSNPSLSANQNEERVRQGSFFVCRHMGINLLNGNVHKYRKESCYATSSFWFALDAVGRHRHSRWASAARSVPSNPSRPRTGALISLRSNACSGCPWQRLGITKKSLSLRKKMKIFGFFL